MTLCNDKMVRGKMVSKIINLKDQCVGCGTCEKVCSVGAISMVVDEQGFRMPYIDGDKCINCNQCEKACPQIEYSSANYENPNCYGVIASEEILEKSSSGGAFSVLCDYIFERNGYVCGAAYDSDFRSVSHIMISNREELYKLRGSKYVRSDLGNIFNEIREKLENDEYVLFSGTPCQVVALYNVLGKEYEKLVTVDLICSGVPSEKVYGKYIEEISLGKKIKTINMRPKKYGWEESGIQIVFDDDSEYMIQGIRDPYLKAYLKKCINYTACYNCQFAVWPRKSDFTIGDLWHAKQLYFKENFEKGISCLTVNNFKAEKIFDKIRNNFANMRKLSFEFLRTHNMTIVKRRIPLFRERFFSLISENMKFVDAVEYAINWKFDVAITGCWTVHNYGGMLTYYALYSLIKSFGMNVIMVERRANIPGYDIPKLSNVREALYPYYDVARIHKSFDDQRELNVRVKNFVSGSDQIWNYKLMRADAIDSYMFDYVSGYRKKIAYGASFGSDNFNGTEEEKNRFQQLISKFDVVSTREDSGKAILKEFGINAQSVLDPVMLVDKNIFDELASKALVKMNGGNYMFTYFVLPNKSKIGFEKIAEKLDVPQLNTINCDRQMLERLNLLAEWEYPYEENLKLEDWLCYIKNSLYVITDSFHCVCLSLIYHKNFIFIKGDATEKTGLQRVTSLLNKVGLLNHIVENAKEALSFVENNEFNIDFGKVEELLAPYRWQSRNWLRKALIDEEE